MNDVVGSGVVSAPLKNDLTKNDSVVVKQNTKPVDVTKSNHRHPDPAIAQTIANMVFAGQSAETICRVLKISMTTLYAHYKQELETGQASMITDISTSLAQRAKAGSDTAAIFLLKTRGNGRFNDRQQLELSGQVEIVHKTELVQQLAGMLSAPNVIEGEVVDDKPI